MGRTVTMGGYFVVAFLFSVATCLPAGSMSPDVKVIQVSDDDGHLRYDIWSPSADEIINGQDLINSRVQTKPDTPNSQTPRSDYILFDNEQVNFAILNRSTEYTEAVVELAIICDKAFGDQFNHDRKKILDYWTAYWWEINLHYKTLPSTRISVIVTSVVIISTKEGQPFIENARGEEGKVRYNRIIGYFADYMYKQIGVLPQFDVAMAVTNEPVEWYGGLAYLNAACRTSGSKFLGSFVMSDDGRSMSNMYIASHELAHVLGAPHDDEIDWCSARKYLMSGGDHFFSPCSDITINNYVRSANGACVRDTSNLARPVLDPDFNSVPVNSTLKQCQRRRGNESAFIDQEHLGLCSAIPCKIWKGNVLYSFNFNAIGNSPCGEDGNGRCFRGRCLEPSKLIVNSASKDCMRSANRFTYNDEVEMVQCPTKKSATPLDSFVWKNHERLETPYSIQEDTNIENADKCLVRTGSYETGYELKFDRCSSEIVSQTSWLFSDAGVGNGELILLDGYTQRCVKQEGNKVQIVRCNPSDATQRWRFE